MSVSAVTSYGTCSSEHDVLTATSPAIPNNVAAVVSAASRSVRQTLRPSTSPATSVLSCSPRTADSASTVERPATKSTPTASTGEDASTPSASPRSPK